MASNQIRGAQASTAQDIDPLTSTVVQCKYWLLKKDYELDEVTLRLPRQSGQPYQRL